MLEASVPVGRLQDLLCGAWHASKPIADNPPCSASRRQPFAGGRFPAAAAAGGNFQRK